MTWVAGPEGGRTSPLAWSVPFLRIAGSRFRLHWIFLAYAAVVLLRSALGPGATAAGGTAPAAPAVAGIALVSLLGLVALREVARAIVVQSSGGVAESVALWPLGALEGVDPAPRWRATFAAALTGPCISAVIFAALAVPLGVVTGEWLGAAFPHPLDDSWLRNPHPTWIEVLWVVHRTNVQLALLNLLPLVPLDMGLVVTAWFIRSRGEGAAPRAATKITLGMAIAIAVGALVADLGTTLAVAMGCFAHAALALRRIQAGDAMHSASGWMPSPRDMQEDAAEGRAEEERARERDRAEAEGRELDRILEKIARHGLESLTRAERTTLQRATERRRRTDGAPEDE